MLHYVFSNHRKAFRWQEDRDKKTWDKNANSTTTVPFASLLLSPCPQLELASQDLYCSIASCNREGNADCLDLTSSAIREYDRMKRKEEVTWRTEETPTPQFLFLLRPPPTATTYSLLAATALLLPRRVSTPEAPPPTLRRLPWPTRHSIFL